MTSKSLPDAPHRSTFFENGNEVLRLLEIHKLIAGDGPGHKHNVGVLNKSAIVLLVASWESYIEELAVNSFNFLIKNCKSHKDIPQKVLSSASKPLKESKNELDVWKLAGDGWSDVLENHKEEVIKKYVKSLNTPKTENIDDLFECLLGVRAISSHWHWKGVSVEKARKQLEILISTRGEIAHEVRASKPITKASVIKYEKFLNTLAMITHNRCTDHLHKACGKRPWIKYKIGNIT